jgi:hypothetical protein
MKPPGGSVIGIGHGELFRISCFGYAEWHTVASTGNGTLGHHNRTSN